MGSVEAYSESLPQYFILTALAISRQAFVPCVFEGTGQFLLPAFQMMHVIGPNETAHNHNYSCIVSNATNKTTNLNEMSRFYEDDWGGQSHVLLFFLEIPQYYYFRFTYYMTLTSCVFGIVKFLDVGPTRFLAHNGWINFVQYVCACISVFIALEKKALGLGSDGLILDKLLMHFTNCTVDQTDHINGSYK